MNGIVAPIVAAKPAPFQTVLDTRRRISVVMVVYMTGEALAQSIECVLADPLVDEFVIVDNGSSLNESASLRRLVSRTLALRPIPEVEPFLDELPGLLEVPCEQRDVRTEIRRIEAL